MFHIQDALFSHRMHLNLFPTTCPRKRVILSLVVVALIHDHNEYFP